MDSTMTHPIAHWDRMRDAMLVDMPYRALLRKDIKTLDNLVCFIDEVVDPGNWTNYTPPAEHRRG